MNDYQKYIAISRYARYLDEHERREPWPETVARYFAFFDDHVKKNHSPEAYEEFRKVAPELTEAVVNLKTRPSMRCLMTAGPALESEHVAGYNCSYVAIDNPEVFSEIIYILMCGRSLLYP